MANEIEIPVMSDSQYVEYLIDLLLDKSDEQDLHTELYGYPSDYLDDPRRGLRKESVINGNRYLDLPVLAFKGDCVYTYGDWAQNERYRLYVDNKGILIDQVKLDKLIHTYAKNGYVLAKKDTEAFYVRIPIKMLLKDADYV